MQTALPQGPSATSDAKGNATFTCIAPAQSEVWNVTFALPNATANAIMTLAVPKGNTVGDWVGKGNFGPVQITNTQAPVVTATGLLPSTNYQLQLVGMAYLDEPAPLVTPAAVGYNLPATQQFLAVTGFSLVNGASHSWTLNQFTFPPGLTAANFRGCGVAVKLASLTTGGAISVELQLPNGDPIWAQSVAPGPITGLTYTFPVPLLYGDPASTLVVTNSGTGVTLTVDIAFDQEPTTPAVLIGGTLQGVAFDPYTTTNQVPVAGQRAGGSGAGTTQFGPNQAINVTSISFGYAYSTVTMASGQLILAVQDGGANEYLRWVLNTGETGNNVQTIGYPGDGVLSGGQMQLVVSGSITTLTGQCWANVTYRV